MRRLRTRCEACGEVPLRADDILVSDTVEPDQASWSFRCPGCGNVVEQRCDAETRRLLLMSGARQKPATQPMGFGELASLRALLDRPDFVDLMRNH
jgi:hypothetical protein